MGSDNTFSELCPICGTEMNDNWIGEERILICPKCSFCKETASGMWSKCGKLDDTAIETCGAIRKITSPILLDGYDGKEAICILQMRNTPNKGERKMEFDKNKILTVVTGSKELEGKAGWLGDTPTELTEKIKKQDPEHLLSFDETCSHPFEGEDWNYTLFYPAPEPNYAERQAEWIKENNVKVGTKVRFTKGFKTAEDGSGCCEHRDAKGVEGFVSDIEVEYLFVRIPSAGWAVPFTALEIIKEPTYRPYNNDELNDLVGEVLTNKQSGRKKLVTGKPTASEGVNLDGSYISAKDLLASFYRNTDKPCGVMEEA